MAAIVVSTWKREADAHLLDLDNKKSTGLALFNLLRGEARAWLDSFKVEEIKLAGKDERGI